MEKHFLRPKFVKRYQINTGKVPDSFQALLHCQVLTYGCYDLKRPELFFYQNMRNSCVIFSFYPVVLGVSCFFMIITLVIYSRDKAIRNNYTWIVSHFVLNMLLAFIILIVNQSADIKTLNEGLCTAIGKHLTIRSNNRSIKYCFWTRSLTLRLLFQPYFSTFSLHLHLYI